MESFLQLISNLGEYGIIVAALLEATFLPVPMETISIPVYLLNNKKALFYVALLIIFSSIGSIIGYFMGKYLGAPVISKMIKEEHLEKIEKFYNKNAVLALLSSAFTPIPYEAYTLSAGLFKIDFKKYIICAIVSRIIRHLPQAIIIYYWGKVW